MKKATSLLAITMSVLMCSLHAMAQKQKITNKNFEGLWQISMQKSPAGGDKFLPPRSNDFKIYDANGNFRHIIYTGNKYAELSNGKIEITSDSTYTEHLNRHIGVPPSVKEGKVVFLFLDEHTFLMKWTLNNAAGQEIYERVK
ncbi:DUF4488 domain-containing protein [Niabella aquatica]